jgi:5'-3' exonuclease
MGIKNLNNLLRSKCPQIFKTVHLSKYAYKKFAIDVSLFLCKFKACAGDNWLASFINLVSALRQNDIHCVFIFDSGHPPEKINEKEERVLAREKNVNRISLLEEAIKKFEDSGEFDVILDGVYEKLEIKTHFHNHQNNIHFKMKHIKEKVTKMRSNIFSVSKNDFVLIKELFDILKVSYFNAPLEAETMCADLCKRGLVDAVLTEDTDVLAYGCNVFLTKIDIINFTCVEIVHSEMLQSLNLSYDEFLDLCIMCGTDYNKNIPKIGYETSYKYISLYKSIENIKEKLSIDVSILKHETSRRLFKDYERYAFDKEIPYNGFPDYDSLKLFISANSFFCNVNKLVNSYKYKYVFIE